MIPIFVSYATKDRDIVTKRVVPILKAEGFKAWIDHTDITVGDAYHSKILQGLNKCPWYLIALTPNSQRSENVTDELHWAIAHRSGRIIPVMLDDCDPYRFHMRLPRLQYVDFRKKGPERDAALRKVLKQAKESRADEPRIDITHKEPPRDDIIELVAVVLTLLPREEQKHLRHLRGANGKPLPYTGRRSLRHELRHLCDIGALERKRGRQIGELKDAVKLDLARVVSLTPVGKLLAKHVR